MTRFIVGRFFSTEKALNQTQAVHVETKSGKKQAALRGGPQHRKKRRNGAGKMSSPLGWPPHWKRCRNGVGKMSGPPGWPPTSKKGWKKCQK